MITFLEGKLIIFTFIITGFLIKKDKFNIVYLLYLIILICLISMSGYLYPHYMMIFIPALIYPFSCIFKLIDNYENELLRLFVYSYIGIIIVLPIWGNILKTIPARYYNRNTTYTEPYIQEVSNIITKNTNKKDRISAYGNIDVLYLKTRRLHATKYSYQFPISEVSNQIKNEYFKQLSEELPKLIIIDPRNNDEMINNFLKKHNYKLIESIVQNESAEWRIFMIE